MAILKEHKEFYTLDLGSGWEVPPGYPPGIEQQILAGSLDEKQRTGFRTRHLRFKPGVYTTVPFVHEYWEEVYLVSGDLVVGSDGSGKGGEKFGPNTYACEILPPARVNATGMLAGGHKIAVKGLYIHASPARINLTSVVDLGGSCR